MKAELTGNYYYCQNQDLPRHPIIKYPNDLVVSADGNTIYAINTVCSSDTSNLYFWNIYFTRYGSSFPDDCTKPKISNSVSQSYIYEIHSNETPKILQFNGKPLLSCRIGQDIEIGQDGSLYLSDIPNNAIYQYDFKLLKPVLKLTLESYLSDGGIPNSHGFYFRLPIHLKSLPNKLAFQSSVSIATGSEARMFTFNFSTLQQETIMYSGGSLPIYDFFNEQLYYILPEAFTKGLANSKTNPQGLNKVRTFPLELYSDHPEHKIPLDVLSEKIVVPFDLVVNMNGIVYVSDIMNHSIWTISLDSAQSNGEMKLLAGSGQKGYKDGKGSEASFYAPTSLSLDAAGNVYVADTGNSAIRKITPDGTVTTFYKAPD